MIYTVLCVRFLQDFRISYAPQKKASLRRCFFLWSMSITTPNPP